MLAKILPWLSRPRYLVRDNEAARSLAKKLAQSKPFGFVFLTDAEWTEYRNLERIVP